MTCDDLFLTLDDMSLVRGTSLQGFIELVDELGGDSSELLQRAHLSRDVIGDHDSFIGYRSVVSLLELAAQSTGAADFGRRLASRQGLEILGPVGVAARTAPTVGAALHAIEQYMAIYSPALSVGVAVSIGQPLAAFEWSIVQPRPPAHPQAAELSLGVSLRVFRLLAGNDFLPTSLQLRHAPLTETSDYAAYFGCPVEFSAPTYGFRFPSGVLTRRLDADSAMHAVAQDYLATIAVPHGLTELDAVTRLIRRMLATGVLDLELIAEQLALHPRTLQRHLAAQGTSFAELIDQVRQDEAERYLRDTAMPLGQLAGLLGFSEQSVLSRACRRWFDASPSQVRRDSKTPA